MLTAPPDDRDEPSEELVEDGASSTEDDGSHTATTPPRNMDFFAADRLRRLGEERNRQSSGISEISTKLPD
jgi:hypothetical protein